MYQKLAELIGTELTENEGKCLNEIMEHLSIWEPNGEPTFSDLITENVASYMEESIKSVRGYLGSLVKKEYIYIDNSDVEYKIIYILNKTRELYGDWNGEEI